MAVPSDLRVMGGLLISCHTQSLISPFRSNASCSKVAEWTFLTLQKLTSI